MAKLLDARGKEWDGGRPTLSTPPLEGLSRLGIRDLGDRWEIDKKAMAHMRAQQSRRLAMTRVPNAPRHLMRDVGGMAYAKGSGRWPHISLDMLRDLRERTPILQPIMRARGYQVRRLSVRWPGRRGTVGYRVVHKDHNEHDAIQPKYIKPYIQRFQGMMENPAPSYGCNTTGAMMTQLMEDFQTINRPVMEVIHSAVDPRRVVQFRAVAVGAGYV